MSSETNKGRKVGERGKRSEKVSFYFLAAGYLFVCVKTRPER
jgi:hypothetical protein